MNSNSSNTQVEKKQYETPKISTVQISTDPIEKLKAEYPNLAEAFSTVELEQLMLFARKCLDYGIDNISGGQNLDDKKNVEFALNGIWYRMQDKMNRWKNAIMKGYNSVNCESIQDTFQDLANYAIISQLVFRGLWKK